MIKGLFFFFFFFFFMSDLRLYVSCDPAFGNESDEYTRPLSRCGLFSKGDSFSFFSFLFFSFSILGIQQNQIAKSFLRQKYSAPHARRMFMDVIKRCFKHASACLLISQNVVVATSSCYNIKTSEAILIILASVSRELCALDCDINLSK